MRHPAPGASRREPVPAHRLLLLHRHLLHRGLRRRDAQDLAVAAARGHHDLRGAGGAAAAGASRPRPPTPTPGSGRRRAGDPRGTGGGEPFGSGPAGAAASGAGVATASGSRSQGPRSQWGTVACWRRRAGASGARMRLSSGRSSCSPPRGRWKGVVPVFSPCPSAQVRCLVSSRGQEQRQRPPLTACHTQTSHGRDVLTLSEPASSPGRQQGDSGWTPRGRLPFTACPLLEPPDPWAPPTHGSIRPLPAPRLTCLLLLGLRAHCPPFGAPDIGGGPLQSCLTSP